MNTWTPKERILIDHIIGEKGFDVNDDSIVYYGPGDNNREYRIEKDDKQYFFTCYQLYRNFKGDVIDEKILETSQRPKLPKYFEAYLKRLISSQAREE